MASVRFSHVELRYGCHQGRFEFQAQDRPYVISGPNGSGKSTIIEALARALFGFRRQRKDDRKIFDQRRPWRQSGYRASVSLDGPVGSLVIERDFDTDEL